MEYETLKDNAEFVEEGLLLIQPNKKDLWINLIIKTPSILLFDYHTGELVQTLSLSSGFDCGDVMSSQLDTRLKSNDSENVIIRSRDEGQKLRIGINLAANYAAEIHDFSNCTNVTEVANSRQCRAGSENSDSIPDTPTLSSQRNSMNTDDAKATITPGTVNNLKMLLGSNLRHRVGEHTYAPRATDAPPDPQRTYANAPVDAPIELQPDYYDCVHVEPVVEEVIDEYASTMEVTKPWLLHGYPTRGEAEDIVKGQLNGTFVVRSRQASDSSVYPYAVTMAYNGRVVHIQVQRIKDGLVFAPWKAGETAFADLDELIKHYQDSKFYFATQGKAGCISLRRYD